MDPFFHRHTIDKSIPIPLYYQLKEILLQFINKHEVGAPLPTEEELSKHYGISRPTTRQAIRELENNGLVERQKGKGTFICEKKINQDFLTTFEDFEERMQRLNLEVRTEVLEFALVSGDDHLYTQFSPDEHSNFYKIRKIRFANDLPMVLSLNYLPEDLFPELTKQDVKQKSLRKLIVEDYGYTVIRYEKSLEVKAISSFEADLLGVPANSCVQFIGTTSYIKGDLPIEYTMERYRSDRSTFKLSMTLNY